MNKNTNFFERLLQLSKSQGVDNVKDLAKKLGYASGEKIYRLKRDESAHPSVDMLLDISNTFENVDLNWLLTGQGKKQLDLVNEPTEVYQRAEHEIIELQKFKIQTLEVKLKECQEQLFFKDQRISRDD